MSRAEHIPLPNWYISAGCIPTIVWNWLSGNPPQTYLHDLDIVYYDAHNLSFEMEQEYQCLMNALYHDLPVKLDIKNQARIHTWYKEKLGQSIAPYDSVEAAINTWLSVTAAGVRKCVTDLIIYAPYGLNDLFSMTVRPNKSVMSRQHYFKKVERWKTQWPRVTIIPWDLDDMVIPDPPTAPSTPAGLEGWFRQAHLLDKGADSMKAVALAVSARKRGNCYDFAQFVLSRLAAKSVETELVNFYDHQITPCQHCSYECLQHCDPNKGTDAPCPIKDDVRAIWEKTWQAEILLLFVPTYGGMPPALWLAFSQRQQAFFREAPREKLKQSVVSAVVLAAPHQSGGASWIPSFMGDEVKDMGRKVVGFEVINHAQFETEYIFDRLINETEIQRRLNFMTERTLRVVQG